MAPSPALQRFRRLRAAGKVRNGVGFKRYAAPGVNRGSFHIDADFHVGCVWSLAFTGET